MQFKLIEPKKTKGEKEYKTEVKVPLKELDNLYVHLYLLKMGIDYKKPYKESNKFIYFMYDGDWMNKDRKEKLGN